MNKKRDYAALEREYVEGTMGLRELARDHEINHSLVMAQSSRNHWAQKRADYRSRAQQRALTTMADKAGMRIAREMEVRDNAIETIDVAITRLREDLRKTRTVIRDGMRVEEPLIMVRPNDIANLIDRLQVLFGRPSQISEERSLGLSFASTDPELLRAVVEATRGLSPDAGAASESPLPRAANPRPN